MDTQMLTNQYYAKWLGIPPEQMESDGLTYTFSRARDEAQKGYSQAFDLYIWRTDVSTKISYGSKLIDGVKRFACKIKPGMEPERIVSFLQTEYGVAPTRSIKFVYRKQKPRECEARMLTRADYPLYHSFFLANNPDCRQVGWLQPYFYEMTDRKLCYGIVVGDVLVCANDLPTMPYMESRVQEIGVNTLVAFRGKGYAKGVCAACISEMLAQNICPQWSTAYGNIASERLAYSLGFEKLSEIITLTL